MEKQIKVVKGGPLEISGDTPLVEMAHVLTFNGEPIDWHKLGDIETPAGSYRLCRCGKSKTRIFCDDTCQQPIFGPEKNAPFDGTETADRTPFLDHAATYTHGSEVLRDDTPLCISAGFCGTRTTKVWRIFDESDDPERREFMRGMVRRCPSGRIVLFGDDGFPDEPALPQEIAVTPGGPYWVRGGIPIAGEDGRQWEPRNRVTLCRCGSSRNKPFCDGTHEMIHFDER
jgi:CDGSH-type Zn-finger protein